MQVHVSQDDRTADRLYGRAPVGERTCSDCCTNRRVRLTVLAAISVEGVQAVYIRDGAVCLEDVEQFGPQDLVGPATWP